MKKNKWIQGKNGFTPLDSQPRLSEDRAKWVYPAKFTSSIMPTGFKSLTGFTLMELMIGVSLFSIALFGMMMLLGASLALGKFSNDRTIAMNETRRVIEEIRHVADTNGLIAVAGTNWTAWANQNLNNVLDNQVTMVTDLQGNPLQNNADPLPIRIRMDWTEKGKATTYSVDTLVTKR